MVRLLKDTRRLLLGTASKIRMKTHIEEYPLQKHRTQSRLFPRKWAEQIVEQHLLILFDPRPSELGFAAASTEKNVIQRSLIVFTSAIIMKKLLRLLSTRNQFYPIHISPFEDEAAEKRRLNGEIIEKALTHVPRKELPAYNIELGSANDEEAHPDFRRHLVEESE